MRIRQQDINSGLIIFISLLTGINLAFAVGNYMNINQISLILNKQSKINNTTLEHLELQSKIIQSIILKDSNLFKPDTEKVHSL